MKTFKQRVQKNCFIQIKAISSASNMVEVQYAISDALADVFKTRNRGIFIVDSEDKEKTVDMFERRQDLTVKHNKDLYRVLLSYVPEGLQKCTMFQVLKNKVA